MDAVARGLLHHRDRFVQAARALFALLTAASGRSAWDHTQDIARIFTDCGLRTGPAGVERRHATEWVREIWGALDRASGASLGDRPVDQGDHRAVALARAALWPEE